MPPKMDEILELCKVICLKNNTTTLAILTARDTFRKQTIEGLESWKPTDCNKKAQF
jgi:hypothetical protein